MNIQEHIDRLKKLAEELGDELRKDMVLLGGMLVPFYITEANEELPRPTKDTDLIVPEMSYADFIETYDKQMRAHGFRQGDIDDPICRWRKDDLVVDLLMVNSPQMGSNLWYEAAIQNAAPLNIDGSLSWRAISPAYLLMTKLEAYIGRGIHDPESSHDLEDIITLINGRPELQHELPLLKPAEQAFTKTTLSDLLLHPDWQFILQCHLTPQNFDRAAIIQQRLLNMI